MDTRTSVWVSTAERTVLREIGNFLESLEWSERQLCLKTRPLSENFSELFDGFEEEILIF